jgi:hypothetical protein
MFTGFGKGKHCLERVIVDRIGSEFVVATQQLLIMLFLKQ